MRAELFTLSVFLVISLPYASSNLFGRRQRVIAKGRLLCGTKPEPNVLVKLVDEDDGKSL